MLSDDHEYDKYWRLNDYLAPLKAELRRSIEKSGRKALLRSTKNYLISRQHLSDRGRLAYENEAISTQELLRFIVHRGLEEPEISDRDNAEHWPRIQRSTCIATLEAADDNQVFSKFVDLPPELRERIYRLYLEEFPSKLKFPTQPPLARTCRLTRHEVLPLSYNSTTFRLYYGDMGEKRGGLRPCLETFMFLESLRMTIRTVDLRISLEVGKWSRRYEDLELCASCHLSVGSPKESGSTKVEPDEDLNMSSTWMASLRAQMTEERRSGPRRRNLQLLSAREPNKAREQTTKGPSRCVHSMHKKNEPANALKEELAELDAISKTSQVARVRSASHLEGRKSPCCVKLPIARYSTRVP